MMSSPAPVAIITGSSRGIGLAAARLLAFQGTRVVLSSRKADACARACQELTAEGFTAIAAPAHAGRDEDVKQLVDVTIRAFGRVDMVVANAATNPVFDRLTDTEEPTLARIWETNLLGPLRLARYALPYIAATGGGAMVVVSSVNARFGMEGSGGYGLSKAALEQMTRQLAVEWGAAGIRVNAVAPGTVRTDMARALAGRPGFLDSIIHQTPLGRIAEPEDVGAVIAFLASRAARHVTGQVLVVDGGQTIRRGAG